MMGENKGERGSTLSLKSENYTVMSRGLDLMGHSKSSDLKLISSYATLYLTS